jgi:hypothetical protein
MIDEAKANTIQPAPSSENVLADRRLREEVDQGPRDHPEYVYFNLVAISIEVAVRRSESRQYSIG